jgi:hypothetical protein
LPVFLKNIQIKEKKKELEVKDLPDGFHISPHIAVALGCLLFPQTVSISTLKITKSPSHVVATKYFPQVEN